MVFQPESPRYLVKKNREGEAAKILARIRNLPEGHDYITYEINKVKEQLVAESVANGGDASFTHKLRMLRRPSILQRLLIGFGLMTFLALTGVNSINVRIVSCSRAYDRLNAEIFAFVLSIFRQLSSRLSDFRERM